MTPKPYRIDVSEAVLTDLRDRLAQTRWPDAIPGAGWDEGADLAFVQELCQYWREGFDWRKQEAALNAFPQFRAVVDGVDLHFWHVKGKGASPFPLLLVHGWPGSIYEFHHLIGPLTDPAAHGGDAADAFDVVIPALPGYGWSGKPTERGWGPSRTAAAFNTLMVEVLGYDRYGTQGGDWGGSSRPGWALHILSISPGSTSTSSLANRRPTIPRRPGKAAAATRQQFVSEETAYSQLHGTKPMSLAIAQADSPAGIAAWIVEKFRTWSDCGGDIESVYSEGPTAHEHHVLLGAEFDRQRRAHVLRIAP